MKSFIFSVRDAAINTFDRPFDAPSEAAAKRALGDVVNNSQHPIGAHPEDYELFCVGAFDNETGRLVALDPTSVATCKSLVKVKE